MSYYQWAKAIKDQISGRVLLSLSLPLDLQDRAVPFCCFNPLSLGPPKDADWKRDQERGMAETGVQGRQSESPYFSVIVSR